MVYKHNMDTCSGDGSLHDVYCDNQEGFPGLDASILEKSPQVTLLMIQKYHIFINCEHSFFIMLIAMPTAVNCHGQLVFMVVHGPAHARLSA